MSCTVKKQKASFGWRRLSIYVANYPMYRKNPQKAVSRGSTHLSYRIRRQTLIDTGRCSSAHVHVNNENGVSVAG